MSIWNAIDRRTDNEWALSIVDKFPRSWQQKLISRWHPAHKRDSYAANISLLGRVRKLADSGRGGISPDAGDAEICAQADLTARDFQRRVQRVETIAKNHPAYWVRGDAFVLRVKRFFVRALLAARGLLDLYPKRSKTVSHEGALKRILCARWWRRTYRKLHARTVEASAIGIGLVSKVVGLYASDDAVKRRRAQNARNAASLKAVNAVNDHFQAYTLADLAARGTANKNIRRVELLTRIAGFELIAKELGHEAVMVTVSCPSRFHKCTTRDGGRVADNPKYDGSTPDESQKYLSKQWSRCRTAAARAGLDWYGFRIAEPQHDGTPHWHILLFMPTGKQAGEAGRLAQLVRHYFLDNESPHEPGAQKHRVDFERIDWQKGSAVGYVIKYISKNIDGHGVGLDLFGNDAITSSQRVEAWASTWRIRQFQQIGGAPVTVWRELRRLHPDNIGGDAPGVLTDAINAINRQKTEPGVASIAWKKYIAAQGGIGCPRKDQKIKLLKEQTGECGAYGEARPGRAMGIWANGVHHFKNHIHVMSPTTPDFVRPVAASVESERAEWHIAQGNKDVAMATARRLFGISKRSAPAWIHVNNCTDQPVSRYGSMESPPSDFAARTLYRKKLRKFRGWEATKTGSEPVQRSTEHASMAICESEEDTRPWW